MMCGWAKEQIAASWMYTSGSGELEPGDQAKLRHHLSECAECAEEMAQLTGMWERLADLPAPEPGLGLQLRWEATLESLGGVPGGKRRTPEAWRFSLAALWPQRPVWQAGIALACLVVGLAVGGALAGQCQVGDCGASRRSGEHEGDGCAFVAARTVAFRKAARGGLFGADAAD